MLPRPSRRSQVFLHDESRVPNQAPQRNAHRRGPRRRQDFVFMVEVIINRQPGGRGSPPTFGKGPLTEPIRRLTLRHDPREFSRIEKVTQTKAL
jgi:hypothetical protein